MCTHMHLCNEMQGKIVAIQNESVIGPPFCQWPEATNLQFQGMNRFATHSETLVCIVLFQGLRICNWDVAFFV